ncbi:MAG: hypothetical protein AB7I30_17375 [Isosphaeraceae bacterium]
MTEERLFELLDATLKPLGSIHLDGEEYREPALDVLRYDRRTVRLHWVPVIGRGLSVVAVTRQPGDVRFSVGGYQTFLTRLTMAVNGRFPPSWSSGLALGLTVLALTPEPIGPGDDAVLREVVNGKPLPRQRAVPLGVLRINLGQEAFSFALARGPEGLFPEPAALADVLSIHLRRFVPTLEV